MRVPENHWYPLLESREVKRKPVGVERLGRRFVFWRSSEGALHAHLDRCPHLGAALSSGHVDKDHIVCPFHGFHYDGEGRCTHIPSVGKAGKIPRGLVVQSFVLREAHGFAWLWWGSRERITAELPYFAALESGWRHYTVTVEWPVHYTRAIENQLDVAHLPFVHRTTIGAGGRSLVEGPYVQASEKGIRVWVTNRRDDGSVRSLPELAAAAEGTDPGLDFLFPGVWMLDLGARIKHFIAFVPINERTTRYYLRTYHRNRLPFLRWPFERMMSLSTRFILRQDRSVVVTQTPSSSMDASEDRLVAADRAISQFRKLHARLLNSEARTAEPLGVGKA
jgi:phenylpropionate dioxygenase-like ring-hydroxylating dioxygenase large terminal subunit